MTDTAIQRKPYQGQYRGELEQPVEDPRLQQEDPDANLRPEEVTWKTRYGDLRRFQNQLQEEIKSLRSQLTAAQKKEIQIPSTEEELKLFQQRYPDVFRHIRSIVLQEFLGQKKELEEETNRVRDELSTLTREAAEKKIRAAHPDFDEINDSEEFHTWARAQTLTIQNMLYESENPQDCIDAITIYKNTRPQKPTTKPRSTGADTLVRSRSTPDLADESGKKIWKASEIGTMHPKIYEKYEAEIEQARREGRIDMNS